MDGNGSFSEDEAASHKAELSFDSTKAGRSGRLFSVGFLGEAKGLSGSACSTLLS